MSTQILVGDCRAVLATLPEASIDACVTDPPYHLTTGKKGGTGPASVNLGTPQGRARVTTGFMGMTWDGGDTAMRPETWAAVLRVLKPGAYLLAFGGTRTYHRMACAIEDAGFEIRDQIGWAYGSGFPKSHNGEWGGTALKPAWEPIVVARKPLIGTVEANWREHGTGALNIDGCRIGTETRTYSGSGPHNIKLDNHGKGDTGVGYMDGSGKKLEFTATGRWPANLIHDGSKEVLACFPTTTSGTGAVKRASSADGHGNSGAAFGAESRGEGEPMICYGDTGSAARFFYCAKADRQDRDDGLDEMPLVRSADRVKDDGSGGDNPRNRSNRNHHPTVKPTDLMRWLCRLVTPKGGTILDPFMGSGSTLKAAELEGFSGIGIEINPEYVEIARRRVGSDAPLFAQVAA